MGEYKAFAFDLKFYFILIKSFCLYITLEDASHLKWLIIHYT